MISLDEARALLLGALKPLPAETVAAAAADGRVLAREVRARLDQPRFDQSAMDGYAVRAADAAGATSRNPRALRLQGEMPAGTARRPRLRSGGAVRVFTGSALPAGADAVVMQEDVRREGEDVLIGLAPRPGDHVRRRGEELRRGDPLLPAGAELGPASLGLLAAHGVASVRAVRRPVAALITMGDEVVPPGAPLAPGRIRDANGPAVAAALRRAGAARVRRSHAADDPADLRRRLAAALRGADVVVTVGGASVGDHDHAAAARAALGVRELYDRVAIKPGKPNLFGLAPDGTPVFGLPGNPVSALVSCHLFVLPALRALQGRPAERDLGLRARLASPLAKPPGRLEWVRATLARDDQGLVATPVRGQGSHMLTGLAAADALIAFPRGATRLAAGDVVAVRLLDW